MKKSLRTVLTVTVLTGAFQLGGLAMAMPDALINAAPAQPPVSEALVLVSVPNPEVVTAVTEFVDAWQYAQNKVVSIQAEKAAGKKLTDLDRAWIRSKELNTYNELFARNLNDRVDSFKSAFDWNGNNKEARHYRYVTIPAATSGKGTTDSYGYDVLNNLAGLLGNIVNQYAADNGPITPEEATNLKEDLLATLDRAGTDVNNSELRSYMNELVWFAAKQTVKTKAGNNPTEPHIIDLRAAINAPQK